MRRTCHPLSRGGRLEARGYAHWNAISCSSPLQSYTHLRDQAEKCTFMKNDSHYRLDPQLIFDADPSHFIKLTPLLRLHLFTFYHSLMSSPKWTLRFSNDHPTHHHRDCNGSPFSESMIIVLPLTKGQGINLALFATVHFLPGTEHLLNPDPCRWTDCILSLELLVCHCKTVAIKSN